MPIAPIRPPQPRAQPASSALRTTKGSPVRITLPPHSPNRPGWVDYPSQSVVIVKGKSRLFGGCADPLLPYSGGCD
jgi:hypothetical protein